MPPTTTPGAQPAPGFMTSDGEVNAARIVVGRTFSVFADAEVTWETLVKEILSELPKGFDYRRQNLERLVKKAQAEKMNINNRWGSAHVLCARSGHPNLERPQAARVKARRQTSSKKCGCPFKVTVRWPRYADNRVCRQARGVPRIAQVHSLEHNHDPPPGELSAEAADLSLIRECEDAIQALTEKNFSASDIYKVVAPSGQELSHQGKQKIRKEMRKVRSTKRNQRDAMKFIKTLTESDGMFVRFKLNDHSEIDSILWATKEQQADAADLGDVIMQDNTFGTNWGNLAMFFFVAVDSMNKTRIVAQGMVYNERTESYVFALESYVDMSGGRHPEVFYTDADAAVFAAAKKVLPSTLHKTCYWHMKKNILKHLGGLPQKVFERALSLLTSAVFTPRVECFDAYWNELVKGLEPYPKAATYMQKNIYGTKERWAQHVHPGLLTLGITSTQRVEGTFSVIKRHVGKTSSLQQLGEAIAKTQSSLRHESDKIAATGNSNGVLLRPRSCTATFLDHLLQRFQPVLDALGSVGASQFAIEAVQGEITAGSMGYKSDILAVGAENCQACLASIAGGATAFELSFAPDGTDLSTTSGACRTSQGRAGVSEIDTTQFARTSLNAFLSLIEAEEIILVARVVAKCSTSDQGHIVIIGGDGFSLCSCLANLSLGRPCRHYFSVYEGHENEQVVFNGASLHERWRPNGNTPWSLGKFADRVRLINFTRDHINDQGSVSIGEWAPEDTTAAAAAAVLNSKRTSSSNYADGIALGKEIAAALGQLSSRVGARRVIHHVKAAVTTAVKAEKESEASNPAGTIFRGAVSRGSERSDNASPPPSAPRARQGNRGAQAGQTRPARNSRSHSALRPPQNARGLQSEMGLVGAGRGTGIAAAVAELASQNVGSTNSHFGPVAGTCSVFSQTTFTPAVPGSIPASSWDGAPRNGNLATRDGFLREGIPGEELHARSPALLAAPLSSRQSLNGPTAFSTLVGPHPPAVSEAHDRYPTGDRHHSLFPEQGGSTAPGFWAGPGTQRGTAYSAQAQFAYLATSAAPDNMAIVEAINSRNWSMPQQRGQAKRHKGATEGRRKGGVGA